MRLRLKIIHSKMNILHDLLPKYSRWSVLVQIPVHITESVDWIDGHHHLSQVEPEPCPPGYDHQTNSDTSADLHWHSSPWADPAEQKRRDTHKPEWTDRTVHLHWNTTDYRTESFWMNLFNTFHCLFTLILTLYRLIQSDTSIIS